MITLLFALVACRLDPGDPSYPTPVPNTQDTGGGDPDFLPGSEPWEGQDRLSLTLFYEGGFTDQVLIDELTVHYYVYEGTFTQEVDLIDRVEGLQSDVIVQTTLPWWGGGIHSDVALDLSAWTTLHVSLKSDVVADFDLGMTGGVEGRASVADYGYAPDGAWHDLIIPLSDLTAQGVDLSAVTVALLLVAEGGAQGDRVHIDDLYLSKD
jgi:hypothetical protein